MVISTKHVGNLTNARNNVVDLLKGLSIIGVIIMHSSLRLFLYDWGGNFWIYFSVPTFLLLSGYTWTLSYEKHNFSSWKEYFKPKHLFKKLLRFVVPFLIAFLLMEIIYMIIIKSWDTRFFFRLFTGGYYDAGGYFILILLQLWLMFPFLYLIVQRFKVISLVFAFGLSIILETIQCFVRIPFQFYQWSMFRYITFISFGIYLFSNHLKPFSLKNWKQSLPLFSIFAIGIVYISIVTFIHYDWHFFEHHFPDNMSANALASLYLCPIMFLIMRFIHLKNNAWGFLGRASYSIFLLQMVIYFLRLPIDSFNPWLSSFIYLITCILSGLAYYYIVENNFNQLWRKVWI